MHPEYRTLDLGGGVSSPRALEEACDPMASYVKCTRSFLTMLLVKSCIAVEGEMLEQRGDLPVGPALGTEIQEHPPRRNKSRSAENQRLDLLDGALSPPLPAANSAQPFRPSGQLAAPVGQPHCPIWLLAP